MVAISRSAFLLLVGAVFGLCSLSYQRGLLQIKLLGHVSSEAVRSLVVEKLEKQRNDASLMLNRLQEKFQQLICRFKEQNGTSDTGGWCDEAVRLAHETDMGLIKGLAILFFNKTVVGLGDGLGYYRQRLISSGVVKQYDAFDGAPTIHNTTNGQVGFIDLSIPQYWLPKYDWVLCLEVIEHIPTKYEETVLENIANAAGVGIVISWASGEGGFQHVNWRPLEYARRAMKRRGFYEDVVWSLRLRSLSTFPWFKNNVFVFKRKPFVNPSRELLQSIPHS